MAGQTHRTVGLIVLVASCAVRAFGAGPPAQPAVPFQVDTASSRVYIKVTSATRLGHDHGVAGRLASGAVALGGAGSLVFDMRSFVADPPEARRHVGLTAAVSRSDAQKTTTTMLGDDVLSVAQYPTARYTIRSATPLEGQAPGTPGKYHIEGDFLLHGVARVIPLTAQVEATETPGVVRMRCGFTIRQTWFGMRPYSALGGLVGVNDPLTIWGDLVLRPTAAVAAHGSNRS